MAKKNCSKCGGSFDCCNETKGCWCENYSLDEGTLKELEEKFENCLCENCLKEYSLSNKK
ncbi:MAG TPA: cysteine-rich CWC family protein [Bacteroidia bacterium]|jgi:hypothetical protein